MSERDPYRRERSRSRMVHEREAELVPLDRRRATTGKRIVIGIVLGSFLYLITTCFYEYQLHAPKAERAPYHFRHGPQ
jgi:hypothetical protein